MGAGPNGPAVYDVCVRADVCRGVPSIRPVSGVRLSSVSCAATRQNRAGGKHPETATAFGERPEGCSERRPRAQRRSQGPAAAPRERERDTSEARACDCRARGPRRCEFAFYRKSLFSLVTLV